MLRRKADRLCLESEYIGHGGFHANFAREVFTIIGPATAE